MLRINSLGKNCLKHLTPIIVPTFNDLSHNIPSLRAISKMASSELPLTPKAVIFDMGGVILPSPMAFFRAVEQSANLPERFLSKTIVAGDDNSAWSKLERGELLLSEFVPKFEDECAAKLGRSVVLGDLMRHLGPGGYSVPHPEMVDAIKCLRADGIKVALLTNNWLLTRSGHSLLPVDPSLFDVVVESSLVGMRKPEPRIYQHALNRLEVKADEAIFLDDFGANLKPAREMGMRTILVQDPKLAIRDLERLVGRDLRGFVEGTISTPSNIVISKERVKSYLTTVLKMPRADEPTIRCFEHGQSNPTYLINYAGEMMVLRKKPPGQLLPSAHQVEREYAVMKAVRDHGVPVPKMIALCEDSSILGTPFYLMEYCRGRVFKDVKLPGFTPQERRQIYGEMCRMLAAIHRVDIKKAGLVNFGKSGGFLRRNFSRWSKQYEASKINEDSQMTMELLMKWISKNIPSNELSTLAHGDFKLDNMMFHPERLEVIAVLDWELSTIGDPFTDLANNCVSYYQPPEMDQFRGFGNIDFREHGIPTVDEYIAEYSRLSGLQVTNWSFYMAYTCFRSCAILTGVYRRSLQGQASTTTETSQQLAPIARLYADIGWKVVSDIEAKRLASVRDASSSTIIASPNTSSTSGGPGHPSVSAVNKTEMDKHGRKAKL